MKNTNDIIRSLDCCSRTGETCEGCAYDGANGPECTMRLLADAHQVLTDMQDRCARYADLAMVLQETLRQEELPDV